MKVEMGKKYKTRRGVEVRILAVDLANAPYTVAGFIKGCGLYSYTAEGKFATVSPSSEEDLVEVSEGYDFKMEVPHGAENTDFHDGSTSWSGTYTSETYIFP